MNMKEFTANTMFAPKNEDEKWMFWFGFTCNDKHNKKVDLDTIKIVRRARERQRQLESDWINGIFRDNFGL